MLIDFHCHTKATKSGEDKKRNIKPEDFKNAILNAQVKMVAITNHNEFNKEEFIKYSKEVNDDFILLPGIELDIKGIDDERGHVVIVYDNTDIDNFDIKIKKFLNGFTPDDVLIQIDELIDFVNDLNCIILAHYIKPDSLNEKSIEKIKNSIINNYRFFYEPSSYRTLGIMINNSFRALKGSDIVDWNKYSEQEFANIKLDIDSYKNLMLFMKKDQSVIESLLNKQNKYEINISYDDEEEKVLIYDNINIFFGTKGTGKSVSLDKISKYYLNLGRDVKYYSPDKTAEKIQEKLKVSDEERKLSYYDMDNKEKNFKTINTWSEPDVTQFIEYINYHKYKGKNKNKEKMKILSINQTFDYDENALNNVKNDYNNFEQARKKLDKINLPLYLDNNSIVSLKQSLYKLYESIFNNYSIEFDQSKSTYLANNCIDQIKKSVEKNTETKTVPTGTGFKEYAKSLFKLENDLSEIIDGFTFELNEDPVYIGSLEENKKLYKKTHISMLKDDSKAEDGFVQITKIRTFRKCLVELYDSLYSNNLNETINTYKEEYKDNKNISLDDFLGIKKYFVLNDLPYKPSTGESTMILLDEALDDSHDIYILDEPEKSLGNNYISEVLVPKLNGLAKLKKVVVIATHNANIAVRTFPYCSILKTYYNGNYNTYVGNPYINKLINIHDSSDTKNWKDESISILEGGREAFNERSDIYE